jgi:hypothetical protein
VPDSLRDRLTERLGPFPLFQFWGPATTIASTRWIADATKMVMAENNPTLVRDSHGRIIDDSRDGPLVICDRPDLLRQQESGGYRREVAFAGCGFQMAAPVGAADIGNLGIVAIGGFQVATRGLKMRLATLCGGKRGE